MAGPISKTTITGGTPPTNDHKYELTLKFKLCTYDEELDAQALGDMLDNVLRDYQDGRHPFEVEMIISGLDRCLKRARYECVCDQMQEKYGNELVTSADQRSNLARWHLEAGEAIKTAPNPSFYNDARAEIKEVTDV